MAMNELIRRPSNYYELKEAVRLRGDRINAINVLLHDRKNDPTFGEREILLGRRRSLQQGFVIMTNGEVVRLAYEQWHNVYPGNTHGRTRK